MEYIRDKDPRHADAHMVDNLNKALGPTSYIPTITWGAFKTYNGLLNNNLTANRPDIYNMNIQKAKDLITNPNITFD